MIQGTSLGDWPGPPWMWHLDTTHGVSADKRVKVNYGNSLCHSQPQVSISSENEFGRWEKEIITWLAFCGKLYELLTCQAASTNSEKLPEKKLWVMAWNLVTNNLSKILLWLKNVAEFRNNSFVSCHWIPGLRKLGYKTFTDSYTQGQCISAKQYFSSDFNW